MTFEEAPPAKPAEGAVEPAGAEASTVAPAGWRRATLCAVWGLFWLLLLTLALQDHLRTHPVATAWKPLLWEGSSCVVATWILARQWRRLPRLDGLLHQPRRWWAGAFAALPLAAPLFVTGVYAIRHGVYALLGQPYAHEPWPQVYAYEMLKFALFYALFVAALFGMRSHAALLAERLRAERSHALTQQARLAQLAQQIEPHFLFNAINTIAATVHSDPALADTLLTRLAALLRAATDVSRRPLAALDDELELARGYAEIMAERFRDRVRMQWEIDPLAGRCEVPALSLQPLLENAFRHGVEAVKGPVHITVRVRCEQERLHVEVEDDASALAPQWQPGVGLGNLRERLAWSHGDAASLALSARPGRGVRATMQLPCRQRAG